MDDIALKKTNVITISFLKKAYSTLTKPVLENKEYPDAEENFFEYLEYCEIEQALDALEALGEANDTPTEFWHNLLEAAKNMKFDRHIEYINSQINNNNI